MVIITAMILAGIYLYFVLKIGSIEEGIIKRLVCLLLVFSVIILGFIAGRIYLGCLVATGLMLLFDLFYDQEYFSSQWRWIAGLGGSISIGYVLSSLWGFENESGMLILILLGFWLVLSIYRKQREIAVQVMVIAIYGCYFYLAYTFSGTEYELMSVALAILTLMVLERVLTSYAVSFERKTTHFQQELVLNQYEEVKQMYLNMRGFRHDYHNHLQAIKAYLHLGQIDLAQTYLLQLEDELEQIDSSVRSGNLMADAILNSKIAVAKNYEIEVICKAQVPEYLLITDVDLCVVLGNLLDNAIEACQKIEENRFIRIYMVSIKKQLYVSIQNAAKEELNFNEKHYISSKRGNHGLGMKRVQILVDKYEGYLNLQNEPGIFAVEVTLPL